MSATGKEDLFSVELENHLNGIEISDELGYEKYNELIELGKNLAGRDFSKNSNKEAVLKKVQKNMYLNKGDFIMKKTYKIKRIAVVAASFAVVLITLMQTAFAQDFFEKIINSISLGHINAVQMEPSKQETRPISDELKGKLFDKDGNPLEVFSKKDEGGIFTAVGEKIVGLTNGEIVTEVKKDKMDKERKLEIKNSDDLNKYTCFNVILPSYLPDGYKFDRAELYKDEDGTVSEKKEKYIDIYFTNETTGKYIYMQQRFADEETAYEFSTDSEIEEVKINGIDAVLSADKSIAWETDKVLYFLAGKGEIDKSELIKIAESIK
ncbi:MAG: DUF4367 domain-containing protein [Ruminiclostridium sp.]